MAVDMLKNTFSCKMRFFKDDDRKTLVRWYFCEPKAKLMPYTIFATDVWRDRREKSIRLGMVPGSRKWDKGENKRHQKGQCKRGTDQQFAEGLLLSDLEHPEPMADCCLPRIAVLGSGAIRMGGMSTETARPTGAFVLAGSAYRAFKALYKATGAFLLAGSARMPFEALYEATGAFLLAGSARMAFRAVYEATGAFQLAGVADYEALIVPETLCVSFGGGLSPLDSHTMIYDELDEQWVVTGMLGCDITSIAFKRTGPDTFTVQIVGGGVGTKLGLPDYFLLEDEAPATFEPFSWTGSIPDLPTACGLGETGTVNIAQGSCNVPTISSPCCFGGLVAPKLYATFENVTGCDCLDGFTLELEYDPFGVYWFGQTDVADYPCFVSNSLSFTLYCNFGNWYFTASGHGPGVASASGSCSPMNLRFLNVDPVFNPCDGGTARVNVTLTD